MSAVDRQVIARVKSIEGEVTATALNGSKRVLMVGDFTYSDEVIDTVNGKIFLVQDGDIVLQKDIAAIFAQENLSPDEKENVDKILKELEGEEASLLAKLSKDKFSALASGEAGQDHHEAPFIVSHGTGEDPGVQSQAQILVSFEPIPLPSSNDFSTQLVLSIPETSVSGQSEVQPIDLRATTLNQLDTTQLAGHSVVESYGVLAENNNIVKQDIQASYDIFMKSHPDAVLAVTVTGNMADYNAAPLEFPAPIILPFGIGMQPWTVIAGNEPNTVSYLYRKSDLNLLNALDGNSKQTLMEWADKRIETIHNLNHTIEQQISGISTLSLDQFEIKANLTAHFNVLDGLRVRLQQNVNLLTSQKAVAESNLDIWKATPHNFGIIINNGNSISNRGAILELEQKWKDLGGTPETIPSLLESLYAQQAIYQQAADHFAFEIMAKQGMLNVLLNDIISPLANWMSYTPINDADYKQILNQASLDLAKQGILAEGYKNALQSSLDRFDLILRTGLTNDADFGFKTQILLVSDSSNQTLTPEILTELYVQDGGHINVDALASGLKVDFNGHLTNEQMLTVESQFDITETEIKLHLKLAFANPSADENIHIEIPGIPGLTWTSTPPPILPPGWHLNPDNSLTLDLPAVAHGARPSLDHVLILNFPTTLLKNINLSQAGFKVVVNSQVVPTGDNEADLSNNTLHQEFGFDLIGEFPARALYMIESVSQNQSVSDATRHVSIDIKPLLENVAVYINLLSGAAETNFLNNTKIEFKFFNVDPTEPPKVLLSDGVPHPGIDFVKVGDSWILTGQSLKNYVEAWQAATSSNNAADIVKYENPYIIAAPYGADDMSVTVFGVINGANQVVVQPLVPIVIDAVAQGITGGSYPDGSATFEVSNKVLSFAGDFNSYTRNLSFDLKVNIASPNGDGSENKVIDINLTQAFASEFSALTFTPNWNLLTNSTIWHTELVGTDVHLIGNFTNVPGVFSSDLSLGFNIPESVLTQPFRDAFTAFVQNNIDNAIENPIVGSLNVALFTMQQSDLSTYTISTSFYPSGNQVIIDLSHVFGSHLREEFSPNWELREMGPGDNTIGDWSISYNGTKAFLIGNNLEGQGSGSVNLQFDFSRYEVGASAYQTYVFDNILPVISGGAFSPLDTTVYTVFQGPNSNVDLSNVQFNADHTIFDLKVNLIAPDTDGSEARLIDINLKNVFQFDPARSVPDDLDANWQVFSNNSVWRIEIINGEPHLLGNLQGVPGTTSSQLELGFNTALLQYLPKNANGNYEIIIGGPAFNQQGTNPAGVISQEILGPNEQDFNLGNDTTGPTYLAAGTSVEVPAATVLLKEAQVGVEDLTPGVDAFSIDISAALDAYLANIGIDEYYYLYRGSAITVSDANGNTLPEYTVGGRDLYDKIVAYNAATTASEKAEIATILYHEGQYNSGTSVIKVDYSILLSDSDVGGNILPLTTVIFDAVGSGTDVPIFTTNGYIPGSLSTISVLELDFNVSARDISSEIVVVTIQLPHAPDASVLASNAPAGLTFGWQLNASSSGAGSPWSLNGDTLTGTFNLATLNTLNLESNLSLNFNNTVLQYLNPSVVGNNIIDFTYTIHSTDSSSPNNYITGDNQSPALTGTVEVILTQNENALSSLAVVGSFPEIYLGNLPEVPNADIELIDGAFDFNAANAARMSTMLHVTIDFADPDPALTRTVAVFLPKTGDKSSADIQQRFLDWKLLTGVENGWSIDTTYNSATEIKLVKTYPGDPDPESEATGNIDDYVPVSFLLTAVGSFDQRTLTSGGPTPIEPQEMGLHVQVTTTAPVDIGGGQTAIQVTSSPVIATFQDITVPPFVMTDAKAPTFTSGNDYYYIENPGAGLSRTESNVSTAQPAITLTRFDDPFGVLPKQFAAIQIAGYVNAINSGTPASTYSSIIDALLLLHWNIDVPANTDYGSLGLNYTVNIPIPNTYLYTVVNSNDPNPPFMTNITFTPSYTLQNAQQDINIVHTFKLQYPISIYIPQMDAALKRLDPNFVGDRPDDFYRGLTLSLNPATKQTISYSYSIFSGDVVNEIGIGHIFNPDAGDDTIIGSHGRDVFNAGEQSFVTATSGGVATNTASTITFGNEVFVGGLGRDWIESGAGSDVVYSDGTPLVVSLPVDIGPAYAPIFLTTGLIDSAGRILGIFLPKITDVISTGSGDDVIYTGGANYDSYLSAYPGNTVNNVPPQFVGGIDDGVSDKSAGVLVFAGPGDNIIFSGKGADVIILDDTIGLTRVVPTTGSGGLTVSMSNLAGLNYVYNATDANGDVIPHGDYNDMFNGNSLNTVQSLINSGQIFQIPGQPDLLVSYLYDVIRPIYDSSYDTKLTYNLSSSTNPLTAEAITAEHGNNTLVYWKDSVSTNPDSADIVMYFDVTKDKINLTALFNELAPNMTEAQRLAAIHWTPVTSVSPYDATAETQGGTNVGMDGTRITVTIGSNQYQIADLANVHVQDVVSHLSIFDVNKSPDGN